MVQVRLGWISPPHVVHVLLCLAAMANAASHGSSAHEERGSPASQSARPDPSKGGAYSREDVPLRIVELTIGPQNDFPPEVLNSDDPKYMVRSLAHHIACFCGGFGTWEGVGG
jgi:hypothetical protein